MCVRDEGGFSIIKHKWMGENPPFLTHRERLLSIDKNDVVVNGETTWQSTAWHVFPIHFPQKGYPRRLPVTRPARLTAA